MQSGSRTGEKQSLIQAISGSIMLLSALLILLLGTSWFIVEIRDFRTDIDSFETALVEERKTSVRNEVNRAIDFMEYTERTRVGDIRQEIEQRVEEAHDIAVGINDRYGGRRARSEVEDLIVNTLRQIRFLDGRGYYFVDTLDGVNLLQADRPEVEGTSLYDTRDSEGKYVIREMIDMVTTNGAGFIRYTWTKPGSEGSDHPKLAFVRYFGPYRWLIGTGAYLEDVHDAVEQDSLDWIGRVRFGEEGYLFVLDDEGRMISHLDNDIVGETMLDYQDREGTYVVREILERGRSVPGGDFLRYYWEKPSSGEDALKLSYVRRFGRWGWTIGAGVYLDSIQQELDSGRDRFQRQIQIRILLIVGIYIVAALFSVFWVSTFKRRLGTGVDSFTRFFQRAATEYLTLDPDSFSFREFGELAEYANRMVADQQSAKNALSDSLAEKETLLKEIHHRVKNNLQVISSILSLQMDYIDDARILEYFRESQGRIGSMALIHEELYESENFSEVEFEDYCRRFVPSVVTSHSRAGSIGVRFDCRPVQVPMDVAIPLGLILNELTLNSIKHAFPEGRRGSILVHCAPEDGHMILAVADDGIGLPDDFDPERMESLGMQLVVNLAVQIGADLSFYSDDGSRFRLRVPLEGKS